MTTQRSAWVCAMAVLAATAGLCRAGSLDSLAAPGLTNSAMFTLDDIYQRLMNGTPGAKRTGPFREPTAAPGSTGHTTDEIMGRAPALDNSQGATSAQVLVGRTFWGLTSGQWGPQTGAMPVQSLSPTNGAVAAGYYSATNLTQVDADLATGNIRAGVNIFGVAGKPEVVDTTSGDAGAGDLLSGKKAWVDGAEVTGSILTRTLSPANDAVLQGYYTATNLTLIDSDLTATNIRSGVTVFGVGGALYARLPKSGQTSSYRTGDDGDLEVGVPPPISRFTVGVGGAATNVVTDNLTGLMWCRDANLAGLKTWNDAVDYCNALNHGGYDDWRLPNVVELSSLLDFQQNSPVLPAGHPFLNVQSSTYWTSTSYSSDPTFSALVVSVGVGTSSANAKTATRYVWPVRGRP